MGKRISLDQNGRNKLNKVFSHLSRVSIWAALTWKNDSDVSRKVRYVAVKQCGGVIVEGGKARDWDWETEWHTAEQTLTQTYGPRIMVTYDETTFETVLYVDGKEHRRESIKSIPEYEAFQEEVEKTAISL